jgi:hypothetical protein
MIYHTYPSEKRNPMSTEGFIIALFVRVDDAMQDVSRQPHALLSPSEIVTLALLCVFKNVSTRRFHVWLTANFGHLFPRVPERSRLLRLFARYATWAKRFLADLTEGSFCDTFGMELVHPHREGRSEEQVGRKGLSNKRWIVGIKAAPLLNAHGLIVDRAWDSANTHDQHFRSRIAAHPETICKTDSTFHGKEGDPHNLCLCTRGEDNERMLIETVFSLWTSIFGVKKIRQRTEAGIAAWLWWLMTLFNLLATWDGIPKRVPGCQLLSIRLLPLPPDPVPPSRFGHPRRTRWTRLQPCPAP